MSALHALAALIALASRHGPQRRAHVDAALAPALVASPPALVALTRTSTRQAAPELFKMMDRTQILNDALEAIVALHQPDITTNVCIECGRVFPCQSFSIANTNLLNAASVGADSDDA